MHNKDMLFDMYTSAFNLLNKFPGKRKCYTERYFLPVVAGFCDLFLANLQSFLLQFEINYYEETRHADLYTVSRCRTRGEFEDHTSEKAGMGSTLALKPRADVTRSPKQGYQWPNKKDLCPQK